MINRQPPAADVQLAIDNQRSSFGNDTLVVGLKLPGFEHIADVAVHDAFSNDVFAFGAERLQVAVVAALQQSLAIAYVNGVRGAIDQRPHELELVAQCSLGGFALLDLAPHVIVPGSGNQ
ncbi:hypothetical protein D3C81_1276830 [compost metagenome]